MGIRKVAILAAPLPLLSLLLATLASQASARGLQLRHDWSAMFRGSAKPVAHHRDDEPEWEGLVIPRRMLQLATTLATETPEHKASRMAAKKAQKEEQQKRHAAMQAARDKKKEEQEERKEAKAARDAAKKSKSPSSPPKPAKSPKSPSPPKKSPSPSPVPPKKSPSPSPPKSPVKPTTPTPSTPKPTTPSTPSTPSKGSVNPADVSVIANLQAAATLTADAADLLTPKNQYYANLKSTEQALQNAVILINQGQRALVATQVDNSVATLNGVSVMLNKVTYKDALDLINQAKTKAATAKTDFKP